MTPGFKPFTSFPTVASNKQQKRFMKRGEKSWLHLLLVKCKPWKNGFKRKPVFWLPWCCTKTTQLLEKRLQRGGGASGNHTAQL